jgi:hypothetical protein
MAQATSSPSDGSGDARSGRDPAAEPEDESSSGNGHESHSTLEELAGRLTRPFDIVLLTRERIQATLDEAAERGRMTRADANELVAELVRRGRQQTDELLDRARRTVGAGPSFPIAGYDELTVGQVAEKLPPLTPAQLRRVRDYERRHANRKSVLAAIEKLLG